MPAKKINKIEPMVRRARLRKLLCPVTMAGARLSNIAYNLKQREDCPADIRDTLDKCQKQWDEAIRAVPNSWRI